MKFTPDPKKSFMRQLRASSSNAAFMSVFAATAVLVGGTLSLIIGWPVWWWLSHLFAWLY